MLFATVPGPSNLLWSDRIPCQTKCERKICMKQRWDDDRVNQLLDAARVVLEAAGGWEIPADNLDDDPARLLRFTELYFSEGVRRKIWPHVDLMNRGIEVEDPEDLRLGVLGLLRVILCTE
jgi:hypothetical protein